MPGLQRFAFPLEPDSTDATYNLDLLAAPAWRGTILALGVEPDDAPDANLVIGSLRVGEAPRGPPQIRVKSFGADEAILRAGRYAWIQASWLEVAGPMAAHPRFP